MVPRTSPTVPGAIRICVAGRQF